MIIDLHCDLLLYLLHNPNGTAYDSVVRCSIPQLQAGNVKLQVMAISTITEPDSEKKGLAQAHIFQNLPSKYPEFKRMQDSQEAITIIPAIENASAFCSEKESLQEGLKRLEKIMQLAGKPLYVSLTWNWENRFGGGTGSDSSIGLKEDGKRLIDVLHAKKIAIDFSHTSDKLADQILQYIDKEQISPSILASHSNFRTIQNAPRNLPDYLAKEIIRRKGLIGINFVRPFVGGDEEKEAFALHVSHALELGGEDHLAFGADFFYENDIPERYRRKEPYFFKNYGDSSSYPRFLSLLKGQIQAKISNQNAGSFMINGRYGPFMDN